jgi:benzoyl-CoA reductase/2-hydroxyglutaryl-CoA dehydratase subunit BcrC/BadD/HgdB
MMTEKQAKKKAINRLSTMYPLRNLVNEAYLRTLMASQAGEFTAWSMLTWWQGDVILKAMGIEVVYPENYATIVASMGEAERYMNLSDADGFPSHMCGYARTTIGYTCRMMKEMEGRIPPEAPMGGMAKPAVLVGAGTACDARFKWFQSLGRYLDVPMWVLELPHLGVHEITREMEDDAIRFVVSELESFINFLERLTGRKMDWARMEEYLHYGIEIQKVFHKIDEMRKSRPCPMHSSDFWSSMPAALFLSGDPAAALKLYQDMQGEILERVKHGISGINAPEKYRLVFAELPPWHSLRFFDSLAERGWNFVMESRAYHPVAPLDLEKVSNPLEKIARICFRFIHGCHDQARLEGVSYAFVMPYLEYARSYCCDGAFLHPLLTCRMASSHLKAIQEILLERVKVPCLMVEGDIVDIRLFNLAQTLSKAEAFEATMDHYRRIRRKEGFPW